MLSIEDGGVYKADFVMATLMDGGSSSHQHHTTHNRTTYEESTLVQNQTNGFDSLHKEPSIVHSPKITRPNASIRTHSPSAEVDFPSGSQFNRHGSKTKAALNVPPPPGDLDLMDIEPDQAEAEQQVEAEQQAKTQSESLDSVTRQQPSVVLTSDPLTTRSSTGDTSVATRIDTADAMADGFDVMDAIFGADELNDFEGEGNQFGFGVEKESTVGGLERDGTMVGGTQDSIINDSGFLPRSPPAKKVSGDHC